MLRAVQQAGGRFNMMHGGPADAAFDTKKKDAFQTQQLKSVSGGHVRCLLTSRRRTDTPL
jgi:hypothetical protein